MHGVAACAEQHEGLAVAVARRFRELPVDPEDVLQAARLGLVQAARRFDPRSGASFATYAVPIMLGEVRRLIDKSRAVAGARGARALAELARSARSRLERLTGRPASLQEVAHELGRDPSDVAAAIGALEPVAGLAEPAGDLRSATGGEAPSLDWADRVAVHRALAALPHHLAVVVYLRFFEGRTQKEVARLVGASQPVVSRRERQALAMLREHLS